MHREFHPVEVAEAIRKACLEAATAAYEDAGVQGLCEAGRWEAAIGAIRSLDLHPHIERQERSAYTLETPRLLLRAVAPTDLTELHAHWTEPEVRRYLWDGAVIPADRVQEVIASSAELFREQGAGLWAVRRQGSDWIIGCAGLWHFHDPPELELIISLSREWWGQGLARECIEALLQYCFQHLGWPVVQGSADAPNEASLRLLSRVGMRPAGERPGEFGAILVFRISREEWHTRQLARPQPRRS